MADPTTDATADALNKTLTDLRLRQQSKNCDSGLEGESHNGALATDASLQLAGDAQVENNSYLNVIVSQTVTDKIAGTPSSSWGGDSARDAIANHTIGWLPIHDWYGFSWNLPNSIVLASRWRSSAPPHVFPAGRHRGLFHCDDSKSTKDGKKVTEWTCKIRIKAGDGVWEVGNGWTQLPTPSLEMKSVSDLGAEFTIDNGIADRKVVNDKLANAHINLVGMEQDQAIAFCNGKNLHMPSLDEIKTGGYMKGDFLEKLKRPHDMEYWTSDAKDDAGNFIVVRPDGSIVPSWQPNARGGVFTSNAKHYFFCY